MLFKDSKEMEAKELLGEKIDQTKNFFFMVIKVLFYLLITASVCALRYLLAL